jgi:hypothetical protein
MKYPGLLLGWTLACTAGMAPVAEPDDVPPVRAVRTSGPITVDGALDDPGWTGAGVIDRFYETQPGDNVPARIKTTVLLAYDERFLYIGLRCDDPEPGRIRAPFVERDGVIGTDDNVAIFLDTRNDRRSAVELRVNPRGVQADGVFNDASQVEDFAPDFLYDSAARVTDQGWQAELRVPFSSLRYPARDPQEWGIMVWRNYPRDFRYAFHSNPMPRGSNCFVCHLRPLLGLAGLPSASGLLLVPYVSGQSVAAAEAPGRPLGASDTRGDAGLDVKWTPFANAAIDLTLNPDFSQVEGDVAQIAVNERFALFFAEKRPFFLEGVDLLDTPLSAIYTRTITAPRGGLRVTGKAGAASYTALATRDEGGGLVVIPGPTGSTFAPQDFESWVGVTRLRRDLGPSFASFFATGRAVDGGGHNVVFGPDFQWRSEKDTVTAQLLYAHTRTPERPDLAAEWDGRTLSAAALEAGWQRATRRWNWRLRYRDLGQEFRDDQGFIPQVGYREGQATLGLGLYPEGFLRSVQPSLEVDYAAGRDGGLLSRRIEPGIFVIGRRNLTAELSLALDRQLTGDRHLSRTQLLYFVQVDPSRRLPRIGVSGFVGQDIDIDNVRVGRGAEVNLSATVRPVPQLGLQVNSAVSWLDVDGPTGLRVRLFTAQVQRLNATVHVNARSFLRLIGQYVSTTRDPSLFAAGMPRRDGAFSGSALFSYRLNWQTALFVGYGDERALDERESLQRTSRQLFAKIAYALQR